MKRLFCLAAANVFACTAHAEIIINPDGTHSVITGSDDVKTVINFNGKRAVIVGNKPTVTEDGSGKNKNRDVIIINLSREERMAEKAKKKAERQAKKEARQNRR